MTRGWPGFLTINTPFFVLFFALKGQWKSKACVVELRLAQEVTLSRVGGSLFVFVFFQGGA